MSGEHEHGGTSKGEGRSPLRPGARIAGRYRIIDALPGDVLSERYRAEDEASARPVLVRAVRVEACPDDASRRKLVSAMGARVGAHGRFFGGILDVREENGCVYVVEPAPEGVSLTRVLAKRRASGAVFSAAETLPIAARLVAALDAIPGGAPHGEIDTDRIVVSADGLTLLGGGLAGAIPGSAIRRAVALHGAPRFAAPEWATGTLGRPADVFGVAKVVAQMLIGDDDPHRIGEATASLGVLGTALSAMLVDDPQRRGRSFDRLLEALARHAGLPVPELDAGATRADAPRGDAGGFDAESTVMMSRDELATHASLMSSDDDAALVAADDDDDDDLESEPLESEKTRQIAIRMLHAPAIDDLAKRPRADEPDEVDLVSDELELDDATPAKGFPTVGSGPAPAAKLPPPALDFSLRENGEAPRDAVDPTRKAPPRAPPPGTMKPAPKPKDASRPPPPATVPRAREENAPATRPDRATPLPTIDVSPLASIPEEPKRRAAEPTARRLATIPAPRPVAPTSGYTKKVLALAVASAIAIVLGGIGVAAFRKHSAEREREQHLRERFETLQRATTP